MMISYILYTFLGLWSLVASYFAIKFGLILLNVQDALEESLDVLDEKYHNMGQILEIPLYADTPEIKRLRDDLLASQKAVLAVASKLTKNLINENEDKEELVEER